jgi:fluoride exporter
VILTDSASLLIRGGQETRVLIFFTIPSNFTGTLPGFPWIDRVHQDNAHRCASDTVNYEMKYYYSYALIAAGGFLGAVLRWFIDLQIPSLTGTLVVNFLGCILMGVFMYESIYIGAFSRETRIFFGIGAIGAFTTFSTLAVQSFEVAPGIAILNLAANLVLGLFGIFVGRYIISYQRGI